MFDIGFSELLVLAVVALLVLGPERLPRAARFAGLWLRRARAQWHSVKSELEHDLAAEELRRDLDAGRAALREAQHGLRAAGEQVRSEFDDDPAPAHPAPGPAAAPDAGADAPAPPAAGDTTGFTDDDRR
jgi:sec-independent protein translocase protein TatB